SYAAREKASRKLWELGDKVLDGLRAAAAGDDPEAAFRASLLIRNIEHFITPDTNPRVIELVERYMKANRHDRADIMRDIARLRGWHQMLKLLSAETDPQVLEDLRGMAHMAAVIGAREKLLENKPAEAREYLEMAPRDPQSLMSQAAFCRGVGILDDEIEKAKNGPPEWRAALARAKGDTISASKAAEEAGDEQLSSAMSLFNGDALPWLKFRREKDGADAIRTLYLDIMIGQWSGKEKEFSAKTIAPVLRGIMDARDDEARVAAANLLFLLGEPSLGESTMLRSSSLEAAAYYSNYERVEDALSALGLDPKKPDYNGWVEKRFESYLDPRREDNPQVQQESTKAFEELILLAGLMDQFGMHSELTSAFEKPLLKLAADDQDEFLTFLGRLFSGNNGRVSTTLARNIGAKWSAENAENWRTLVATAFEDDELAMQWWDWMPELDPAASLVDRFDGMLGLLEYSDDPDRLGRRWLDLAWKTVDQAKNAVEKVRRLKRIGFVTDVSALPGRPGDAANALKVRDALVPSEREDQEPTESYIGLTALQLSCQNRWEEAAAIFRKALENDDNEDNPTSMFYLHSYLASSLRRAGKEQDAAIHDQWAEKLALGDWFTCIRNSQGYAFGGDRERASLWLARAALEAPPSLDAYESYLHQYAEDLLAKGRWKEAASLAEAFAIRNSGLQGSAGQPPSNLLDCRLRVDLPRALALLETDRPRALDLIGRCHRLYPSGGVLSDLFFPALRKAGLIKEHDEYFAKSWKIYSGLSEAYPLSHRLHNGTAWLGSRASRNLDEAYKHSTEALRLNPDQAAYLDTMAEVLFAKGDRKAALRSSAQAVNFAPMDPMIRAQYERFSQDPAPGN
ncbi:MAG TPA: hypothetical protein VM511_03350, partial [Luteolibacter sp.]|nr:hypothetical protein [Luteolibacter sp.]